MDAPHKRVRVVSSRIREHIQDFRVHAGETVVIGHRNRQFPDHVWCATEDGHHGWIAEAYLELTGPHEGVALRDYDAAHLTVVAGEALDCYDEIGGWLLCGNAGGAKGWVPADAVEPIG